MKTNFRLKIIVFQKKRKGVHLEICWSCIARFAYPDRTPLVYVSCCYSVLLKTNTNFYDVIISHYQLGLTLG